MCRHTLVLGVPVLAAGLGDLLAVLHPEALVVGALGAGQVALQPQLVVQRQRGVLRRADGRLCGGHRTAVSGGTGAGSVGQNLQSAPGGQSGRAGGAILGKAEAPGVKKWERFQDAAGCKTVDSSVQRDERAENI